MQQFSGKDTQPELMSAVDAAWLRMERDNNQMTISGVLYLDPEPEIGRLKNLLAERLLIYDRFRQVIRYNGDFPCWEWDKAFDIDRHVISLDMQSKYGKDGLGDFISDLMSTPMDFKKPLWEIFVISQEDGSCALVVKLHHCMADGIALISVLLSLATVEPNGRYFDPATEYPKKINKNAALSAYSPSRVLAEAGGITRALVKFATMPADTDTQVKGPLQIKKKAVWSEALPLDKIKMVSVRKKATINDLLMWFMCNALREYLLGQGPLEKDATLRIIIPVDLRSKKDLSKMGNRFGLVFLSLPIGEEDPELRLRDIQRQMSAIKQSREAVVAYGVLAMLGRSPRAFEEKVVDFLSSKCSAVITNVPGPRKALYIAGSEMKGIMFWVPKSGNLGLGISLISYNNQVLLGLAADSERVKDPAEIIEIFQDNVRAEIGQNMEKQ